MVKNAFLVMYGIDTHPRWHHKNSATTT